MKILLVIGTGGFIGAVSRYLLAHFIQAKFLAAFPWGTLVVNLMGCLLIGIVFGVSAKGVLSQEWGLFLMTGILGGFTTFSAFSNDTVVLMREGQLLHAFAYVAVSVFVGLLATFLGICIIKWMK